MIQTQEIGKKPSFRPDLGRTNLGKNQFSGPLWPAMTKIPHPPPPPPPPKKNFLGFTFTRC